MHTCVSIDRQALLRQLIQHEDNQTQTLKCTLKTIEIRVNWIPTG